MPFSASSPKKQNMTNGCNDSGVGIQMGDMSTSASLESEVMECLDPKADLNMSNNPSHILKVEDDDDDDSGSVESESSSLINMASEKWGKALKWIVITLFALGYGAYFIVALVRNVEKDCDEGEHNVKPLIYLTVGVLFIVVVWFIKSKFGSEINKALLEPLEESFSRRWHVIRWLVGVLVAGSISAIIISSVIQRPSNLVSLMGWTLLLIVLVLSSKAPRKIIWRPVIGGFTLQLFFAAFILKWDVGYETFQTIGNVFTKFLRYSDKGAEFVLGSLNEHFFAFRVLPVIIFFSCVITMLYYLGIMQAIIGKIAFVMKITLGTTAAESLCAAGNIFVGQTEAPIMIGPFLNIMTRSELHAVMVGGFSTIAGAVLAAYIMKGVPAIHLLTACVMNAPAALAVSKILHPELGKSKIAKMGVSVISQEPYNNVIEAAAAGASNAIGLVANVAANLIAFVALLHFVNQAISWFGTFICHPELSFELICSYVLMPLAYTMGVEWKDAGLMAELIGIKTFLNEFVAYDKLSEFIDNRINCLGGNVMSVRSETIATYALCGFANLSSIGIQLGGLGSMAPKRLGDFAKCAVTALLGGIVTNLMTACIAGLLVVELPFDGSVCLLNSTVVNATATPVVNATLTSVINATANALINTTSTI